MNPSNWLRLFAHDDMSIEETNRLLAIADELEAADERIADLEQTTKEHIAYGQDARAKWCATECKDRLEAAQKENERMRIAIKTIATLASIAQDAMEAKP